MSNRKPGTKRGLDDLPRLGHDDTLEAEEDRNLILDDVQPVEEVDGEYLMDKMEKDYRQIPELDKYEEEGMDHERYSQMSHEARRRAEKEIELRNREKKQRGPTALIHGDEGSLYSEGQDNDAELRARRELHYQEMGFDEEFDGNDSEFAKLHDYDAMRGKLEDWISDAGTVKYIKRTFKKFLLGMKDENRVAVYENRLSEMCSKNRQSFEVTYNHLTNSEPTLAFWLFEAPALIIPLFNEAAFDVACKLFPGYEKIHTEIYVKFREFPLEEKLRDLRTFHLNTLIKIQGVVTRRYPVYSQLKKIFYLCGRCGNRMGPIYQNDMGESLQLGQCGICHFNGPFNIDSEQTVYRNYQRITVQESPGSVLPGRVPRHKDIILLADNIDKARPGDEVEVLGIYTNKFDYSMNVKHGFPVFNTIIEANNIKKVQEIQVADLTKEDRSKIHNYSRKSNIIRIIVNSIAPSIYGLHHVKTAMALSMFGGEPQTINGSHKIRGDINVLLLGDPGLAKSQFLKYVEQTFHRTVYTTGKGASAVGLTASVRRDFASKEWTLEGGALVLADQGICLIDEFDKMNEVDRTSIHEAMEQQSISISKAGIVASLQARCAVIAAANPIKGRYNRQLSFSDNVNLSDPILSRFDIMCVLKDTVEPTADSDLATFIINSHIRSHPEYEEENQDAFLKDIVNIPTGEAMEQELLKKYIIYARKFVRPKLNKTNVDKISNFYAELRRESKNVGGFTIVTRHIESLIRMAQASARMHLRNEVKGEDIDLAISVLLESFIQSQKVAIGKVIRNKFSSYISFREDINTLLVQILDKLFKILKSKRDQDATPKVPISQFRESASAMNVYDVDSFLKSRAFVDNFDITGGSIIRKNLENIGLA